MLKSLSGIVNYAVSGITIIDLYQNKKITFNETTEVFFNKISEEETDCILNINHIYLKDVATQLPVSQQSIFQK